MLIKPIRDLLEEQCHRYVSYNERGYIDTSFIWSNTREGTLFWSILHYSYYNTGKYDYRFLAIMVDIFGFNNSMYVNNGIWVNQLASNGDIIRFINDNSVFVKDHKMLDYHLNWLSDEVN